MRVGLVPAAVGGTWLEEWGATFRRREASGTPSCSARPGPGPGSGAAHALYLNMPDNANYQPHANRGCHNLLACALRSFFCALLSSTVALREEALLTPEAELRQVRALVGGVVWSQGENDCVEVGRGAGGLRWLGRAAADTYGDRQAAFMQDLRWCLEGVALLVHQCTTGFPQPLACPQPLRVLPPAGSSASSCSWPPIVTVAVTATRPWMVYLREVRGQQLEAALRVPNLLTVDSLGCLLKTDCVHLTTAAALSLGYLLAAAMSVLLLPAATPAGLPVLSIAELASPHDQELHEQFTRARGRCEEVLERHYRAVTREERQLSKKKYPIFGTGLKPVNFVSV